MALSYAIRRLSGLVVRRRGWSIALILLGVAAFLFFICIFFVKVVNHREINHPVSLDEHPINPKLLHAGERTAVWRQNDWYLITTDGDAVVIVPDGSHAAYIYSQSNLIACLPQKNSKSHQMNMFRAIQTNNGIVCYMYDYNADGICDVKKCGDKSWRYIPGFWDEIVSSNIANIKTNMSH